MKRKKKVLSIKPAPSKEKIDNVTTTDATISKRVLTIYAAYTR